MIDGEIRRALDVDPSPEFLARVRTRIAAEPSPSTMRARPKSRIFTAGAGGRESEGELGGVSSATTRTFDGLRSRWITPSACR